MEKPVTCVRCGKKVKRFRAFSVPLPQNKLAMYLICEECQKELGSHEACRAFLSASVVQFGSSLSQAQMAYLKLNYRGICMNCEAQFDGEDDMAPCTVVPPDDPNMPRFFCGCCKDLFLQRGWHVI